MYEVWAERDATTGTYRLVRIDGEELATSEEALRLMLDAPVVEYHINGWGSGPGGFQALTKEAAARPEPLLRPLIDVLNFYFFHHPNETRYPFALEAHDHIGVLSGLLGRPSTPPFPRVHHNTHTAKTGDPLTLIRVHIDPPYLCSFVFAPATRNDNISDFIDSLVATQAWFRIADPPSDPDGVILRPRNRLSAMDHLSRALDIYFMGEEWEDAEVCLEVQEMDGEVEWEKPSWIMDTDIWVRKNSEEGKVYRVRLREFIEEYPLSDSDDDLVRGRERNVFEEAFKQTVEEVQRGRRRERTVGVSTTEREDSGGFTRLMEMTMRELEEESTSEETSTPSLETISNSDYAESSESAPTSFSSDSHLDALAAQLAPRYPELIDPGMFPSNETDAPGLPEVERLIMLTQRAMPLIEALTRPQPDKTTSDDANALPTPPESVNGEQTNATVVPPFGVSTYGVSHYLPDRFVKTELREEEVDEAGARISRGKNAEVLEFLEGRTAERLRGGRASSENSVEVEVVETMMREKEVGVKQSRRTVSWMDESSAISGWDVYGFPANDRPGSSKTVPETDDWYAPPRTHVYYLEKPKVLPYALAPLFDQDAYWVDEDVDQVLAAQKEYWDAGVVRCRIRKVTEVECSRFEATEWKPLADYWCGVEAAYDKDVVDMTGVEEARRPSVPVAHFPTYTQSRLFNPHYLQETSLGAHRAAHLLEHHARRSDLAVYPQFPVITNPRAPFNVNWVAYLYLRQLHKYRYEKFVASLSRKEWQDMESYGEGLIGRGDRFETYADLEDYLQGKNPFFRAEEKRDLFFYVEYLMHQKVRTLAHIVNYILSVEVGDAALIRYLNDRGFFDGDAKLESFGTVTGHSA
ncbi:uncharacterized protein STEHIDRAFT_120966 [Stereum hirsutum FP-91666 SS1]|uniref:uncharacterized protein n=1 Tax=Stereum hirsutum (strain FP-91666) TaxID=721885 RepID=UPI000440B678|nr:uncharacterized protein STEHIDRAFT_120966 [Stereum hirsutum FP-91666 SS1]EIM87300.1 hypothetical protein STEHIDRAFT_120966 [Stereum hirsutum FP-91666 SS1]